MGLVRMQSVLFRICLCRVISLLLFTWPDFSLPHLQLTSAYSLISRPASSSARRQIVSFLPHCGHAWFQICLERWLFFFALFFSFCINLSPLYFSVFQLLNLFSLVLSAHLPASASAFICCIFLNKNPWTVFECPCSHFSFVPLELVR